MFEKRWSLTRSEQRAWQNLAKITNSSLPFFFAVGEKVERSTNLFFFFEKEDHESCEDNAKCETGLGRSAARRIDHPFHVGPGA
jgi:hypothetical protein